MESTAAAPCLSIHVKITVDPANEDAFLQALAPTFKKVTAEPLNVFCEVFKDGQHPGVFKIVENWNATLDHMMNVQVKKEYYSHYHENVVPLFIKPHETEILTRLSGKEWASIRPDYYHIRS